MMASSDWRDRPVGHRVNKPLSGCQEGCDHGGLVTGPFRGEPRRKTGVARHPATGIMWMIFEALPSGHIMTRYARHRWPAVSGRWARISADICVDWLEQRLRNVTEVGLPRLLPSVGSPCARNGCAARQDCSK